MAIGAWPGELRTRVWIFPIAFAVHNLEEAIWLPAWSRRPGSLQPHVTDFEFRFAVSVLTLVGFIVTWLSVRHGAGFLRIRSRESTMAA